MHGAQLQLRESARSWAAALEHFPFVFAWNCSLEYSDSHGCPRASQMSPGQQQSDTHEVEALSWIIASQAICIWKAVLENNRKQCGAWSHLHR